uniref:Gustatory receptor n=1 Tax=Stomoxys calcitrans TaxID=35570 RepID=A0A1I8QC69_STOCA
MPTVYNSCLSIILYGLYYFGRCLGIVCFVYHKSERRVKATCSVYSFNMAMLLITGTFMPIAVYILYNEMVFLRQSQLLTYVGHMRYGIILLCTLATQFMQLHWRHAIIASVNKMLHLSHLHLGRSNFMNCWVAWKVVAKCITLGLQFLLVIFLIGHDDAVSRPWYLTTLIYVTYCQLVLQMTLNILYFGLMLMTLIMRQLNQYLIDVLHQLRTLAHHRGGLHRQHVARLHNQLYHIMVNHWTLVKVSGSFVGLYGWQLLSFLTFVIEESVTQIFIVYFVAMILRRQHPPNVADGAEASDRPWLIHPISVLYVSGMLWDVFLIMGLLDEMRLEFLRTRFWFCSSIWLKALTSPSNQCLENCLSHFNLYLLRVQPWVSYSACGLFTFDKQVALSLLERIFLYVILLIQFHLISN